MNSSSLGFSISLCLICCIWINQFSFAQDEHFQFLNAHNVARLEVGVQNLTWDNGVAAFAELYATQIKNQCSLSRSGIGPYGENLAWSSGNMSASDAVQLWVSEKSFYDYNTNSCASGKVCGHYTQVVWQDTIRLGCFRISCENNGGTLFICNYDPSGNILGQRPFHSKINTNRNPFCSSSMRLNVQNHMPLPL